MPFDAPLPNKDVMLLEEWIQRRRTGRAVQSDAEQRHGVHASAKTRRRRHLQRGLERSARAVRCPCSGGCVAGSLPMRALVVHRDRRSRSARRRARTRIRSSSSSQGSVVLRLSHLADRRRPAQRERPRRRRGDLAVRHGARVHVRQGRDAGVAARSAATSAARAATCRRRSATSSAFPMQADLYGVGDEGELLAARDGRLRPPQGRQRGGDRGSGRASTTCCGSRSRARRVRAVRRASAGSCRCSGCASPSTRSTRGATAARRCYSETYGARRCRTSADSRGARHRLREGSADRSGAALERRARVYAECKLDDKTRGRRRRHVRDQRLRPQVPRHAHREAATCRARDPAAGRAAARQSARRRLRLHPARRLRDGHVLRCRRA